MMWFWICIILSIVFLAVGIYFVSDAGNLPRKSRNKLAVIFLVLAQLSFWAAAWFGNMPQLLDPY